MIMHKVKLNVEDNLVKSLKIDDTEIKTAIYFKLYPLRVGEEIPKVRIELYAHVELKLDVDKKNFKIKEENIFKRLLRKIKKWKKDYCKFNKV